MEQSKLAYQDQTLYYTDYQNDYTLTPQGLTTTEHQDHMVTVGTELNCYDKVLYYIIDNYKPEITDPVGGGPSDHDGSTLVSYDTVSGKIEQGNITGDWAIRVTDEMWGGTALEKYTYKGGLYWILVNGDVVRTDLATAHNTLLFTLEGTDLDKALKL